MSVMGRLVALGAPFGIFRLSRWLTRGAPRVLMYHRFGAGTACGGAVPAEVLERQLSEVVRYYKTFTMAEAIECYYDGTGLPANALVITIDDGYRDFYEVAWPLFKKYGVKATLYVTTGFIDGETWLWPDRIQHCLEEGEFPAHAQIGDIVLPPGRLNKEQVRQLKGPLNDLMLSVTNARRLQYLDMLDQLAGVETVGPAPEAYVPCRWEQLAEMQSEGLEVGGHTVTHPSLGRVTAEQARSEIQGCHDRLNQKLGVLVRSFCYPNGQPQDYRAETLTLVEEAGFCGAVTAFHDDLNWKHRYAIRRFSGSDDMLQFRKAVHGVECLSNRSVGRVLSRP